MKRSDESLENTVLFDTLLFKIIDDGSRADITINNFHTCKKHFKYWKVLFYIFNVNRTEFLAKVIKKFFFIISHDYDKIVYDNE